MCGSAGFERKVARAKKDCEARFLEDEARLGLEGLVLLVAKVEGGGRRGWGAGEVPEGTFGGWRVDEAGFHTREGQEEAASQEAGAGSAQFHGVVQACEGQGGLHPMHSIRKYTKFA